MNIDDQVNVRDLMRQTKQIIGWNGTADDRANGP